VKRFFGNPNTLWPSMRNRLHVYVLPDDELRSVLGERQFILNEFDYCSVQPPEYLHATIQQFAVTSEEVSAEQTAAFMDALRLLAAAVEPFSIEMAAPTADDWALGVRGIATPAWSAVTEGVRAAASRTINAGAPLPSGVDVPHISLGYGLANGSTEHIQRASDETKKRIPQLKVDSLHFLAVHQDMELGTYTWDSTSPVPLTGPPTLTA
jgi:hypothetical protein